MNISEISIRKPVFAWMLMAALILFGWISFRRMGVSMLPDVDFPVVNISVTLEGAAPQVMEINVVDPIEDAIMSVQGVKEVTSSSRTGATNITVEFELGKDIDVAVREVQTTIAQVQRRLPKDIDPPIVSKVNPEDQPILWFTVMSNSLPEKDLMAFVRDHVKDQFSTVPGVGEVFLGGYIEPNLRVWLSTHKLNQYSLAATDVIHAIEKEHSELPAGILESKDREYNIRTLGEAITAEQFGKLTINNRGGLPNFTPIPLSKIATVEEGLADVRRKSRSMGKQAIGLGIKKQRGSNAVEVAVAAKEKLKQVVKRLPPGMEMGVNFDATKFIEDAVRELSFNLALSAVLTALVCWLFLGSWSATFNVILAIPTSIVGSFIALYWLGFTLNFFTLLGLSLAIGIVVDDAIMVLENIVRHREEGKSRIRGALDGSREITFAALAATAAIIAIFLPVAFMKGIIGKYLFQFGVTLAIAVTLSLLEALTLTPMRCAQFLDLSPRTTRLGRSVEWAFNKSAELYKRSLVVVLNHRWKTVAAALIFFVGSLFLTKALKKEFVPAQDQGNLMLRLQTPVGSSLDFTDRKFKIVEDYISKRPELDRYYAAIGGFGGGEVNTGIIFLTLKPFKKRGILPSRKAPLTQQEFAEDIRKDFLNLKDLKVFIQDLSLAGFTSKRGFPVEFTIRGADWDSLITSTQQFMKDIDKAGVVADIDSDYRTGMPEIQISPIREKAQQRGVSIYDVNQTINALIGGVVPAKYSKGAHRYDIRLRLVPEERTQTDHIKQLKVRNNRGELIPISEVTSMEEKPSLQAIAHQGRERAISVYANVAPGSSQGKALEVIQNLAKEKLPADSRLVMSGSSEAFKESFQGLLFALILGIAVSYMVLASQFNSFIHPFTVLVALPFSISGAFISLLLGGQSLNIYSMIGLVLLMGIVKKNSILLVDFTNQKCNQGLDVRNALIEACPVRLRPILMTSIATVVGAIPPAMAIGPGAESRIPMALSVIGGVIVSTFLTLFVVPCVYSLLARKRSESYYKELSGEFVGKESPA